MVGVRETERDGGNKTREAAAQSKEKLKGLVHPQETKQN